MVERENIVCSVTSPQHTQPGNKMENHSKLLAFGNNQIKVRFKLYIFSHALTPGERMSVRVGMAARKVNDNL